MKVLIATPCAGGHVRYEFCNSLLSQTFCAPDRLRELSKYDLAFYSSAGYSGLGKDRGIIASYALRAGFDKLLFIDSDQSWKWQDIQKIIDSDKPIIAGVIALKNYPIQLNFLHKNCDKDCFEGQIDKVTTFGLNKLHEKYEKLWHENNVKAKFNDEIEVQCTGTGFMCIDVAVLKAMVDKKVAPPFVYRDFHEQKNIVCFDFFQTGVVNEMYFGEDWSFCIQAARLGFKSYINSSVWISHHGDHTYNVDGDSSKEKNAYSLGR